MPQHFSGSNLRGRSFKGQDLIGANFSNAKIQGAIFTNANLSGANFSNAKIQGAIFTNANLSEADFSHVEGGLPDRWIISTEILLFLASVVLGAVVGVFGIFAGILLSPLYITGYSFLPSILILSICFLLSFATIRYGLETPLVIFLPILVFLLFSTFLGFDTFRGTLAVAGASTFAVVGCILGSLVFAVAGIFRTSLAVASAIISFFIAIFVIWGATVAASLDLSNLVFFKAASDAKFVANVGAILVLALGFYIARQALAKDEKYALIRKLSIFLTAIGGTNFYKANLTDANFTYAKLKNTNLTDAILTRTYWFNAKLDFARIGESYLSRPKVQQLVVSGEGANENFDRQDFRDTNLSGFNLEKASFIDADFYQADLRLAILLNAKLVRTNFERADLRGARLTGSCIQDWIITKGTKLDGVVCGYVFLKWVNEAQCDQMPNRVEEPFKEGGFVLFLNYILDTIDIYHNRDINPRLALTLLRKMSRDYNEPLDIVAVGKRGDRVFIKVKLSKNTEQEIFKEDYSSRYYEGLKILSTSYNQLPSVDELVENKLAEITSDQTNEVSSINVTHIEYVNIQDIIVKGKLTVENMEPKGDIYTVNQPVGNVVIGRNAQSHNSNFVQPQCKRDLAEAAAEIQKLLKQLEQTNPTATESENIAYVNDETTPSFKRRVVSALQAGSEAAIEEFLDNPYINVGKAIVKSWIKLA